MSFYLSSSCSKTYNSYKYNTSALSKTNLKNATDTYEFIWNGLAALSTRYVLMISALHETGMEQLKVIQYLVLLTLIFMILKLE